MRRHAVLLTCVLLSALPLHADSFDNYTNPILANVPESKLVKEIKLRAVHAGKKLKDAVADLLREGLEASTEGAAVVKADKAAMRRRKAVTQKFVAGEWGANLTGYEAAGEADRRAAKARESSWRD